ncbi:hypothetical protein N658DRAFT_452649 [Parathielavia hyrcaniae]|uniref:Uncharacterized protein n=1 Tax=Parathielavia hyrcaniae TaxID=113614 RepID=A0AAN6T0J0_9PEZI|nr:hypothetical protein N658DRAFT_452649 [Parathielavia hyrcaniae]
MPRIAFMGGTPTVRTDVPICAALIALFLAGAVTNILIFKRNQGRGHKFLFSVLLAKFSMWRIAALALRISWAIDPLNINLVIAAQVVTAAGVLILFIMNLVFAQRIVRSYHPLFGWGRRAFVVFIMLICGALMALTALVTATVMSYYVKAGSRQQNIVKKILLIFGTYLTVYAFLPVIFVTLAVKVPGNFRIDKFGQGHFRSKFQLLVLGASLLTLGAAFRAATAYMPRPAAQPAWFHSRACFYVFNFGIELAVLYLYTLSRVDKRFHIPNKSSAPGHYSSRWYEYGTASGPVASPGPIAKLRQRRKEKKEKKAEMEMVEDVAMPPVAKTMSKWSILKSSNLSSISLPGSTLVDDEDWDSVTQAMQQIFGIDEEAQRLESVQKPGLLPRIRVSRSGDLVRGLQKRASMETWALLSGFEKRGANNEETERGTGASSSVLELASSPVEGFNERDNNGAPSVAELSLTGARAGGSSAAEMSSTGAVDGTSSSAELMSTGARDGGSLAADPLSSTDTRDYAPSAAEILSIGSSALELTATGAGDDGSSAADSMLTGARDGGSSAAATSSASPRDGASSAAASSPGLGEESNGAEYGDSFEAAASSTAPGGGSSQA